MCQHFRYYYTFKASKFNFRSSVIRVKGEGVEGAISEATIQKSHISNVRKIT